MDGVAAIRAVLAADAALTALVPSTRIIAGPMPLGAELPAISLQSISKVDRNIPAPGVNRHVRERVQVTVLAPSYTSQKAVLRSVRAAAADRLNPVVAGIADVTIHTESAGPDFMSENPTIWMGSQDFMVKYTEVR